MQMKRRSLSHRMPDDVRARAERAGAHDVDWYAGRFDVGEQGGDEVFTETDASELRRLENLAKTHRLEERDGKQSLVTRCFAVFTGSHRRRARTAD